MAEESAGSVVPAVPKRRRLKRWLVGLAIALGSLTLLGGGFVGVAEYRTSQPQFCASCHNMVPYYDTWEADLHGGKLDVACVECHYAPGERTTLKAKFRGLSQVTSYFSGRYGATRPRAHVSNDSCMTSKCHGDMKFMDKPIQLGTVQFTHAKHLRRSDDQEDRALQRLSDLQATLKQLVGDERFVELELVATEAGPADDRYNRLVALCRGWHVPAERDTLVEFSQLHHRKVRIVQLHDLQCTNCHAYNAASEGSIKGRVGHGAEHHFSVNKTTCYTCHFNNEGFNTGTNSCLMCHSQPQQEIVVHEKLTAHGGDRLQSQEFAGKRITVNHAEIVEKKVDCRACHADVAGADSTVTRRDCERCHDQPRFFDEWKEPMTLDLVAQYHKVHVREQRAKCLDCHSEIKHQLVHAGESPEKTFLTSVLSDCGQCHPNHHAEQVKLLAGHGGIGIPKSEPNPMFGARTNCYGCHADWTGPADGDRVLKGSQRTCVACHGERHAKTFEQWKAGIELTVADAEESYKNARQALDEATTASPAARKKATELLAIAEADLRLVKHGNGIHNVTYSLELLESVTGHCQKAIAALTE